MALIFLRPLDILLIILVVISALSSFFLFKGQSGSKAEVYVAGSKAAVFDLNGKIQEKEIKTSIGLVRIKYGLGSIQIIKSPCTQKICILKGAVKTTHDHIICVPAQLTITVVNEDDSTSVLKGIDAFSH